MSNVIIEITDNNYSSVVTLMKSVDWGNIYGNIEDQFDLFVQLANYGKVVSSIPTTPTSTGTKNQIAFDETHLYICVDTNSWKRVTFENWT